MIVVCRVTTSCNLECSFCAYDKKLPFQRKTIETESLLHLGKMLSEYSQITNDKVLFSWLGGEPFLWQEIFSVSHLYKNKYGLEVSGTTNGTTLHLEETRIAIIKSFKELTVSVDGLNDFHNSVRGFKNGWQKLKSAVIELSKQKRLENSNLKLRANIVLMHKNIAEFSELCNELATWGINEISFNQLGGRDRPEFYPENRLTFQDATYLAEIIFELKNQLAQKNVILCGGSPYIDKIKASSLDLEIPGHDCNPAKNFLFIDELGRIAPCSFTNNTHGVDLITIKSGYDIVNLSKKYITNGRVAISNECKNCPSTHVFKKFSV